MARLTGADQVERGKELAPLRQKAYQALDQNPELTAKEITKMLGVNRGTAQTWKVRWMKQKMKLKSGKAPEPVIIEKDLGPITTEIGPECVADALLKKVVEALTEREGLLTEIREYKSLVTELEKAVGIEKQDKERILKIHNEQAQGRRMTDTATLLKLAKL